MISRYITIVFIIQQIRINSLREQFFNRFINLRSQLQQRIIKLVDKMMKQQCWKQLRQQICAKQKWIKDQDQPKCQHCNKQFIPLIRRRHHCRFCGNIFCSNCSDFFLNGKYLGLNQKFIRHCQFCHQKIQKFIKDCAKMPDVLYQDQQQNNNYSDEEEQEDGKFFDLTNQDQSYNLNQIFGQNQQKICSQMINKLDEEIKDKIQKIAVILCQKFGLDQQLWVKKLSQIAYKGALQTKMDSFTSQGPYQSSMDIIKQVKIKTLVTQSDKITAILLKGIVLEKNLPSKHMSSHLAKPTILIIQNSIDIESFSSQMKFQDLMRNQQIIMSKIFDKISKLAPDIIFVQGNVNVQAIQYFQQKKICVVSKIKKKDLQLVAQIGNIKKSVKKLWLIQKYKPQNVLGVCDKIYFKNIKQGQTLMFIQSDVGIRTIILGQQTQQLTSYLKKSMQLLLRFSRQLNLQKYLITVDNQISLTFPRSLQFSFFYQLNSSIYQTPQIFTISQEIVCTSIKFGEIRHFDAPKNFVEYGQKLGKSLFYNNCQNVQYHKKKIYSAGDITLGGYLLLNIALNQKQCRKCQKIHTQRYYFDKNVILVRFMKKPNNIMNSKSSFYELNLQQNQQFLTLQRLKWALKKQKSKLLIETYIFCQLCQAQMKSQPIKLGKNYLENSFFYYLSLLDKINQFSIGSQKEIAKQKAVKNQKKKMRKLSIQKCDHDNIARVFQYSGCLVKFSVAQCQKYLVYQINLKSQQGKLIVANVQKKYLKSLRQTQFKQKESFLEQIYTIISGFPFNNNQNSSFSSSYSNSASTNMKIIQKIQRFQKAFVVLQSVANDFKQLKNQQMNQDWTLFMRKIYKFQYTMKVLYQIMEHFQNTILKKRKVDDKMDNQSLLQDMKKDEFGSPQFQNQNGSVYSRQHDQSQVSISLSSSTYLGGQMRKQSQTVDSKSHKLIKKIRKQRFPKYEGIFLKYAIGYTFAPVSILACALNSPQFLTVHNQNQNKQVLKFKIAYSTKIKTSFQYKQQIDSIYKQMFQNDNLTNKTQFYEITIYFPDQFQKLRVREGVNFQTYVKSLCGCQSWDSSGGKSNSTFAKSHNQILVVKIINNKQFVQFKKFAEDYLKYIQSAKIHKKDSLLAKIYGIYQISMRGKQYKCVVMQNLFFGIQNITKVYDLKGSQVNRLTMPQSQKSYTGQDTNFKIDKDNNPYILQSQKYDKTIQILQNDADFLKEQEVIDYSLLVIQFQHQNKNYLKLGIIDFMRPYHILEKIQNIYKKAKMGNDPTVIPPENYGQRFFSAMKKYFIKVN